MNTHFGKVQRVTKHTKLSANIAYAVTKLYNLQRNNDQWHVSCTWEKSQEKIGKKICIVKWDDTHDEVLTDVMVKYTVPESVLRNLWNGGLYKYDDSKPCEYRYDDSKPDGRKEDINNLFVRALVKQGSKIKGAVAYLDAQNLRTTRCVKQYCPLAMCSAINFDPEVFQHALKLPHARNTLLYTGTLNQFLVQSSRKGLRAIWLDYCCTIMGNRFTDPRKDIALLFRNKLLVKGAVFACTVSLRDRRGTRWTKQRFIDWVRRLAKVHDNVRAKVVKQVSYRGAMFFVMFLLE
jgi:hypothetical protein